MQIALLMRDVVVVGPRRTIPNPYCILQTAIYFIAEYLGMDADRVRPGNEWQQQQQMNYFHCIYLYA